MTKKTILTYGTFDLFHIGHVNLLRRLRNLGDELVVGLSSDEFNSIKGKTTVMPFDQREAVLLSCKFVDRVFPEESWDQKPNDIKRESASIFAMGDDWAGKFDELKEFCDVIYLPRTQDVSTTDIKRLVSALHEEKLGELKRQIEHLSSLVSKL